MYCVCLGCYFFLGECYTLDLHVLTPSCPTRRASCLTTSRPCSGRAYAARGRHGPEGGLRGQPYGRGRRFASGAHHLPGTNDGAAPVHPAHGRRSVRSEEHTSELQSLMRTSYAVFCLKKKTMRKVRHNTTRQIP